jgi:AraC family transcriptional regulator, exoenzyme S synthesis regulatory protein ExsA
LTYIVPNFFIENDYKTLTRIDNLFCVNYITKTKSNSVYARTTMHSMSVMLEGSKIIHLNDKDVIIQSGFISFLTQNNYYLSERLTDLLKYKSLVIYFDDKFIFDFIQKYNIKIDTAKTDSIISVQYKNDFLFNNNVQELQNYLKENVGETLLKLKIEEIFLQALRLNSVHMHSFISSILSTSKNRVKFILEFNLDLIQTLDDMCSLTRLTKSKIRRYIKNEYGMTPKVWLDTKRMEKAVLMLKNTDKSISDIAAECGYATVSWFIVQFKKHHTLTPQEFRHQM